MSKALLIVVALLCAGLARAGEVAPEKLATILTRALSYDEQLKSRAKGALVVGILYKSGDDRSVSSAEAMSEAWKRLEHIHVQGMPMSSVKLAFDGAARLKAQIAEHGIDLLFVCDGLSKQVSQIIVITRAAQVLSAAALPDDLRDGFSIGVFMDESQPSISVNLASSRAEGASFSSELLRLAKIVK